MGRVTKRFRAKTARGEAGGLARIDSGADRTVLRLDTACRLGLDHARAKASVMSTAGGTRLLGLTLPVRLRVGDRSARVEAFIPVGVRDRSGEARAVRGRNLVGADFLQGSRAKLDYSRPHRRTFAGLAGEVPSVTNTTRATREEVAAIRRLASCPRRKR